MVDRHQRTETLDTAYVPAKQQRGQPIDSHIEPIPPANNTS